MDTPRTHIGQYDDPDRKEILVEWLEGTDEKAGGNARWLYRRLTIPPKVLRETEESYDVNAAVGFRMIPFLQNGGWRRTRPSDGSMIATQRIFSLN